MSNFKGNIWLIVLLLILAGSCKTQKVMVEKYKWKEATSAPLGYPVDVLRGGLLAADGGFTSLVRGTTIGNWGDPNGGMTDGMKGLPSHLKVTWLSYAEDCFYELDTAIDYATIAAMFKKNYVVPSIDSARPEPCKEAYDQITVGFAPGGFAAIWVGGSGRQIEVGTFSGKKVVIPQAEIDKYDYPLKNLFNDQYKKETMQNERIVPREVQEQNSGKEIPFGKWERYSQKFNWNAAVHLPSTYTVKEAHYHLLNGNNEQLFGADLSKQYQIDPLLQISSSALRAAPKMLSFFFEGNDKKQHGVTITFNEAEIEQAFEATTSQKVGMPVTIGIKLNETITGASVNVVTADNKIIWLTEGKVTVY